MHQHLPALHRAMQLLTCVLLITTFSVTPASVPAHAQANLAAQSGAYVEDFRSFTAKDRADSAVWDRWAGSLRLARPDDTYQSAPETAVATDGSAWLVWEDGRNGTSDMYVQRLDPAGNRLWQADLRVNSDTGSAYQTGQAIALDSAGNAVVVWTDVRSGNFDIYAQKLSPDGTKLWPGDVRVRDLTATGYAQSPDVVVDQYGNAIMVWSDVRGNDSIYMQKLDPTGQRLWLNDIRVNRNTNAANRSYPRASLDGGGNVVIVWVDTLNNETDIRAQRMSSDGVPLWTTDVRPNVGSSVGPQTAPDVAIDALGTALIVWQDNGSFPSIVYAQRVDSTGASIWSSDLRLSSNNAGESEYAPRITLLDSATAVVSWAISNGVGYDISAQRIDFGGTKSWADPVQVTAALNGIPSLTIAADPAGNIVIGWDGKNGVTEDIFTQRLSTAGTKLWPTPIQINDDSGAAGQINVDIAADTNGNLFLTWQDNRSADSDIYLQKLDAAGTKQWSADVRANSDQGTSGQSSPAIAIDTEGDIVVVWEDRRSGILDIYAQKFDPAGNRLWPADVRVNTDRDGFSQFASQSKPDVTVDPNNIIIVVWQDYRLVNPDIYAQKLDTTGSKIWATDMLVNDSTDQAQYDPTVGVDGVGNAVVAWRDSRGGWDIYAQSLDSLGSRRWPLDVRVNSDVGSAEQSDPAIGVAASGTAVIVWHDLRTKVAVYAQSLASDGTKRWVGDVQVNSNTMSAQQWVPSLALDSAGNAIIAWDDYTSGYRIYAQKLTPSGSKQWPIDVQVAADTGSTGQWTPALAVSNDGSIAFAWIDYRNGNNDVFAQRLNPVGNRVWLSDLQVVAPDQFYLARGSITSRTVDTLAEPITSASLTVNVQLNGGVVQFALSNDGGTTWATVTPGVTQVFTTTGSDLRWQTRLSSDPRSLRTPLVTGMRVEYASTPPGADAYEPDDSCANARPIATAGEIQRHTFHQPGDADWVRFDAVAGTTYLVEAVTTLASRADLVLIPYPTCASLGTGSGHSFGRGTSMPIVASQTGSIWLRLSNHDPAIAGDQTDYTLSVRALQPRGMAIIVAGHDDTNSERPSIDYAADRAYKVLLAAGLGKANVRYLAQGPDRDVDGNGVADDIAGLPTPANVRDTVQQWARDRGIATGVPLYVYMVDHGLIDHFKADGDAISKQVSTSDLNLWLSNLEATTGADTITVIIDACYSGSFIDVTNTGPASIAGRGRVVISSTTSSWSAYGPPDGAGLYFSNAFFSGLENQQSVWASFQQAREAVVAQGLSQVPWLDDTGDGHADSADGAVAAGRVFTRVALSGQAPQIVSVQSAGGTIRAEVHDDSALVKVTVEVFAPSFSPIESQDGTTRSLQVPTVQLTDPDGDGIYVGQYTPSEPGQYRLVTHAEDAEGNLALPRATLEGKTRVFVPLLVR